MSHLHVKYLLVGGGVASSAAAVEIRRLDPRGLVLMIGQEINRPYYRRPLRGDYLRGAVTRADLFTAPASWYADNSVALRTGQRAVQLDTARRTVALDHGDEISFDELLIATGAVPAHLSIPGADLPNVFYLHTLEDADRLRHAIDQALGGAAGQAARAAHAALLQGPGAYPVGERARGRTGGGVVIVGAGLLGVELASTFQEMGLEVHLLEAGPYPLCGLAGEVTGRFLANYLESRGVHVYVNRIPVRLEGDGRVQRVVMESVGGGAHGGGPHEIRCDFVVGAAGMVPQRDLLRGTPIRAEKAILVDEQCSTNVPRIYAAGDCAAVFDPLFGRHCLGVQSESARITGAVAGSNMAGAPAAYDAVSQVSARVIDLSIRVWGRARWVDHCVVRGSAGVDAPCFLEFGVASDGRVSQVISVSCAGDAAAFEGEALLEQFVRRRAPVGGREEALKDPGVALADLLPPPA